MKYNVLYKKNENQLNNKLKNLKMELDGQQYLFDWRRWIDLKRFTEIPFNTSSKLNAQLKELLTKGTIDLSKLQTTELTKLASNFKDLGAPDDLACIDAAALEIAIYIIEDLILIRTPGDSAALSVLCSLLRKIGKPKEALEKTNIYSYPNAPLFTSRAAAMCDLELWEDAKKEVGKALAILSNNNLEKGEAYNVVKRIKASRPELYG